MSRTFGWATAMLLADIVRSQYSPPQPVHAQEATYMYEHLFVNLTADTVPDLLINSEGQGLGYKKGLGGGQFERIQWLDLGPGAPLFGKMAAGDLDGDGDVDIAFTDMVDIQGPVRLLWNMGNATFQATQVPSPGGNIFFHMPRILDMDQDGDNDLLLIQNDPSVLSIHLMPNTGGGVMGTPVLLASAGSGTQTLDFIDLNGDGYPDMIHWPELSTDVVQHLNQGNGLLGPAQLLTTIPPFHAITRFCDIDGDQDVDLVAFAGGAPDAITLFRNNGAGPFGQEVLVSSPQGEMGRCVITDMDGDGDEDLFYWHTGPFECRWLENDGAGTTWTAHPLPAMADAYVPSADVDGNGLPDLVTFFYRLDCMLNMGNDTYSAQFPIISSVAWTTGMAVADVDRDGDDDVVTYDRVPHLHPNTENGIFQPQVPMGIWTDRLYMSFPLPNEDGTADSYLLVDINGDQAPDVFGWHNDSAQVFLNDGGGLFTPAGPAILDPGVISYGRAIVDLNNDLIPDMTSLHYGSWWVRPGDGGGGFGAPLISSTGPMPMTGFQFSVADLNGDLSPDLLGLDSLGTAHWYANNGAGSFTWAGSVPDVGIGFGADHVRCADLDGDGDIDLLYNWLLSEFRVNLNDGTGSFGPAISLFPSPPPVNFPSLVTPYLLTDGDGDGDPDLLVSSPNDATIHWHFNDGTGGFGPATPISGPMARPARFLAVADIDNDNRLDVVVHSRELGDTPMNDARVDWFENFSNAPFAINGTVYLDANANGVRDPGEQGLPNLMPTSEPLGALSITDSAGAFSITTDIPGVHAVQLTPPSTLWQVTTVPAVDTVTVNGITPVSNGSDFGLAPVSLTTDLALTSGLGIATCFVDARHIINVTNQGSTRPSGTICYQIDPLFSFVSSDPPPTSINGNTICWNYDSLNYFSILSFDVLLDRLSWINFATPYDIVISATEEDGGGTVLQTFGHTATYTTACPYDPNDKQVDPVGYGVHGAIDIDTEHIDYTIRFQNTGTAPATDVFLIDHLNEHLDMASFQVIGHSHVPTSITLDPDRQLTIRFDGIQLPDSGASLAGSQGHFRFRMKPLDGVLDGTVIPNTASIFFDANPAIVTNTTITTLVDCDLWSAGVITQPTWNLLQAPANDTYQWMLNGSAIAGATDQYFLPTLMGIYTVEVTSPFGCIGTTEPYAVLSTSVNDAMNGRPAVVPNPFMGSTTVIFAEPLLGSELIELLDMNGRTVRRFPPSASKRLIIEGLDLPAGLYTLRVSDGGHGVRTARLMVLEP